MATRDSRGSTSGSSKKEPGRPVSGVISLLEIYRLEEAKARLGWSDAAFREAKRRGLKVMVCGRRSYLSGREIARFLAKLSP
mgnify:CR=1 FL=1